MFTKIMSKKSFLFPVLALATLLIVAPPVFSQTQGMERREDRREGRSEARQDRQEGRESGDRSEGRQKAREDRETGRQKAREDRETGRQEGY